MDEIDLLAQELGIVGAQPEDDTDALAAELGLSLLTEPAAPTPTDEAIEEVDFEGYDPDLYKQHTMGLTPEEPAPPAPIDTTPTQFEDADFLPPIEGAEPSAVGVADKFEEHPEETLTATPRVQPIKTLVEGTKDVAKAFVGFAKGYGESEKAYFTRKEADILKELEQVKADIGKDQSKLPFYERYDPEKRIGALTEQLENFRGEQRLAQATANIGDKLIKSKVLKPDQSWQDAPGVTGYVQDVVRMAPQIATQYGMGAIGGKALGALGATLAGTGTMATQIAGGKYTQLVDQGVEPERAFTAAIMDAAMQAPLEQIGLTKVLSKWTPGASASKIIKEIIADGATEFITEAIQKYPEMVTEVWATTEGMDEKKRADIMISRLWETTKAGLYEGLVALPMGGAGGGVKVAAAEFAGAPTEVAEGAPLDLTPGPDVIPEISEEGKQLAEEKAPIPETIEPVIEEAVTEEVPEVEKDEIDQIAEDIGLVPPMTEEEAKKVVEETPEIAPKKPRLPEEILDRGAAIVERYPEIKDKERREELLENVTDRVLADHKVTKFREIDKVRKYAEDNNVPYTIVMGDGRELKAWNTHHGNIHSDTDVEIKQVWGEIYADGINDAGGVMAREGGSDEFKIILPHHTKQEADQLMESLEKEAIAKAVELGIDKLPSAKSAYNELPMGTGVIDFGSVEGIPGKYGKTDKAADQEVAIRKLEKAVDIASKNGYTMVKDENGKVVGFEYSKAKQEDGVKEGRRPTGDSRARVEDQLKPTTKEAGAKPVKQDEVVVSEATIDKIMKAAEKRQLKAIKTNKEAALPAAIDYMTDEEKETLHKYKMSLPTDKQLQMEAAEKVKQRLLARKIKRAATKKEVKTPETRKKKGEITQLTPGKTKTIAKDFAKALNLIPPTTDVKLQVVPMEAENLGSMRQDPKTGAVDIKINSKLPNKDIARILNHEVAHIGIGNVMKSSPKHLNKMQSVFKNMQNTKQMEALRESYKDELSDRKTKAAKDDYLFQEYWAKSVEEYLAGDKKGVRKRIAEVWFDFLNAIGVKNPEAVTRALIKEMKVATGEVSQDTQYAKAKPVIDDQMESKDLVALHNLTAENIVFSSNLGGIPVPSLAVTQKDVPFTGFGEITLIADKNIVDPIYEEVYSADVYSPRTPEVEYLVDRKSRDNFRGKLYQAKWDYLGTSGEGRVEESVDRANYDRFIPDALESAGVKAMWLKEVGDPVKKPVMKNEDLYASILSDSKAIRDLVKKYPDANFNEDRYEKEITEAAIKAGKEYVEQHLETVDTTRDKAMVKKRLQEVVDGFFHEDNLLYFRALDKLQSDMMTIKRNKKVIDTRATSEKIVNKVNRVGRKKFIKWVEQQADKIFTDPHIKKGRKKLAPTLDNMVDLMVSQKTQGTEGSMTFSLGQARSAGAKRFKSIQEMKAEKESIVTSEEMEKQKDAVDKEFHSLREKLENKYKYYDPNRMSFTAIDDFSKAFYDYFNGKPTEARMRSSMHRNDYVGLSEQNIEKSMEFAEKLRSLPTQYFEAKLQRGVKLNEFSGAVVPKGTSKDALDALKQSKVKVVKYDPKVEGDRASKVKEFAEKKDLFFAKAPATDTKAFKNWFDDSKVVDEDGKPLVVYHGTKSDFNVFGKKEKPLSNAHRLWYFTKSTKYADAFAGKEGNVMPVYLSLKNPKMISAENVDAIEDLGYWATNKQLDNFESQGYDGLMLEDMSQIVVLKPTQIKSATENIGTYDPEKADIRYAKGKPAKEISKDTEYMEQADRASKLLSGKLPGLPTTWLEDRSNIQVQIDDLKTLESEIRRANIQARKEKDVSEKAKLYQDMDLVAKSNHDKIRQHIYDYAKKMGLKGITYNKVDTLLKNTKTSNGLIKAIDAMDGVWNKRLNSTLLKRTKETVKKEKLRLKKLQGKGKSAQDISANKALNEYLNELTDISEDKLGKLNKSLAWFLENPNEQMPASLEKEVQDVFRKSLNAMNAIELAKILKDIAEIKKFGNLKYKLKRDQKKRELDRAAVKAVDEITKGEGVENIVPLEEAAKTKKVGERMLKMASEYGWSHIRPERIIEAFTDFKKGVFHDKVWEPILNAEETKLKNVENTLGKFKEANKDINMAQAMTTPLITVKVKKTVKGETQDVDIPLTVNQGMFVYAHSKNPSNRAHLDGTGFNDAIIDEVINALPQKNKDAVDNMHSYYDTVQWNRLNDVFEREYNMSMPREAFYMPIDNLDTQRAENAQMSDLIARYSSRLSSVQKGMTKSRISSKAPFKKLDYASSVINNLLQSEQYIAYNDAVRDVNQFLTDPDIKQAMNQKSKQATAQINDWLKAVAYGRIRSSENILGKVSEYLRTNYVTSVLGGYLVTIMKQPASFSQGLAHVKKGNAAKSVADFGIDSAKWAAGKFKKHDMIDFVEEKSVMMRNRAKSYEREIAEMAESKKISNIIGTSAKIPGVAAKVAGAKDALESFKEFSMSGITASDKVTTTILWKSKFDEMVNKGAPEKVAIKAADELIRKTQPMGGLVHLAKVYRGNGIERAYTSFTNQLNQNLNLDFELAKTFKDQKAKDIAQKIIWYSVVPSTLLYMASHGGELPFDDPEEWARTFVSNKSGGLLLLNRLIDTGMLKITQKTAKARGKETSPWKFSMMKDLTPTSFGALQDIMKLIERPTGEKAWNAVSKLTGVPNIIPKRIMKQGKQFIESGDVRYLIWSKHAFGKQEYKPKVGNTLTRDGVKYRIAKPAMKYYIKEVDRIAQEKVFEDIDYTISSKKEQKKKLQKYYSQAKKEAQEELFDSDLIKQGSR